MTEEVGVNNAWQRYIEMASGVGQVTKKTAESVVQRLVKQGEVAADRAERAVDELLQRSERNRKAVGALVRAEVQQAVERLGLARQKDVERLAARVAKLEEAGGKASSRSTGTRRSTGGRKTSTGTRRAASGESGEKSS